MELPRRAQQCRGARDHGAAAVEFSLILPLVFLMLFGIIDYGLWFNDSLSLRQGVRESARQAAVQSPKSPDSCATTPFSLAAVNCETDKQIAIGIPGSAPKAMAFAPNGWTKGQPVVVCGMAKATSFTGFVPTPSGGVIKSKTTMSIEDVSSTPAPLTLSDTLSGWGDWSWCTYP